LKLIIAGGRNFNDYDLLKEKVDYYLKNTNESVEIVSGKAKGADTLGERYAKENGYGLSLFPADWNRYGKGAGYIRNKEMAEYATHCICFWDGESRGTKMMIDLAKERDLKVRVINYKKI